MVALAAVGLAAGYSLKAQCLNRVWDGIQFRRSCYNDVQPLYFDRGLNQKRFPYLDSTAQTRVAKRDVEYPAGTGLYMGVVSQATSTPTSFFNANAIGLALMGLAGALALAAMALDPRRVLLYAVGPAMVLYAFHNWDLLAVGFTTLALYAYWRGANVWAGLLLGIGAATKLYPAFLLPALALGAWQRDRKVPWRMGAAFVGGVATLNVPIMLANFAGWKYPWDFQSARPANFETSWFMIYRHTAGKWFFHASTVNLISGGVFVCGSALLIVLEAVRERARPYALSFAILVMFLLTAKVFSPQYALWLLPFFALLRMPWWSYVAFAITDAAVWFSVSAYFIALQGQHHVAGTLDLLEVAVWTRYLVLLVLLLLSFWVEELVLEPEPRAAHEPVPLTA